MLRTVRATSYVTPLREGGSLPALLEADDDGTYVVKFRGAGQGTAALVAEIVVGTLAQALGVRVPELVLVELDPRIARREPDWEIQELLRASAGLNLGMDFLPGSVGYDGLRWQPPVEEAATVHWLDAFTANVDRTWRNPNLLVWHRRLWAIDHGAALVFQHAWPLVTGWAERRYDLSDHVLNPLASRLSPPERAELDQRLAGALSPERIMAALALVPDGWLVSMNSAAGDPRDPDGWRQRYLEYLLARLDGSREWRFGAAA